MPTRLASVLDATQLGVLTPTRVCAQYVCVSVTQDVPLSFGGSEAAAAHATLTSIGGLGPNNAALSKGISTILQAKFGIAANRLYIDFRDVAGSNMVRAARLHPGRWCVCDCGSCGAEQHPGHCSALQLSSRARARQGWNGATF